MLGDSIDAGRLPPQHHQHPQQNHHHHVNHHVNHREGGGGGGIVVDKIFVGGVLYATGHESLRMHFERFGAVRTAEVIYNRDTKKSRGFGFVVFEDCASVQRVMAAQDMQPLVIDGKQVEVKECVARQDTSASLSSGAGSGGSSNGMASGLMHDGINSAGGAGFGARMRGGSDAGVMYHRQHQQQRLSPHSSQLTPTSQQQHGWGGVDGGGMNAHDARRRQQMQLHEQQQRHQHQHQHAGSVPRLRSSSLLAASPTSSGYHSHGSSQEPHVVSPINSKPHLPQPIGSPLHGRDENRHHQQHQYAREQRQSFFPAPPGQSPDSSRQFATYPQRGMGNSMAGREGGLRGASLARTVSAPERDFMTPAYRPIGSVSRDDDLLGLGQLRESELNYVDGSYSNRYGMAHKGSSGGGEEDTSAMSSGRRMSHHHQHNQHHHGYEGGGGGIGPGLSVVGSGPSLRRASSVGTGLFYNSQEERGMGSVGSPEIPPLSLNGRSVGSIDELDSDGGSGSVRVLYQQHQHQQQHSPISTQHQQTQHQQQQRQEQQQQQQQQRHRLGSQHSQHSQHSSRYVSQSLGLL
jgi:hypothetical protein